MWGSQPPSPPPGYGPACWCKIVCIHSIVQARSQQGQGAPFLNSCSRQRSQTIFFYKVGLKRVFGQRRNFFTICKGDRYNCFINPDYYRGWAQPPKPPRWLRPGFKKEGGPLRFFMAFRAAPLLRDLGEANALFFGLPSEMVKRACSRYIFSVSLEKLTECGNSHADSAIEHLARASSTARNGVGDAFFSIECARECTLYEHE